VTSSSSPDSVSHGITGWYHRLCENFRRLFVLRCARRGNFAPLLMEAEAALNTTIWSLGPDHPETARKLAALAAVYSMNGETKEAAPLLQRAIAVLSLGGEATREEMFAVQEQLGEMYRAAGQMTESVTVYTELISRREVVLGTRQHVDVARLLDELALVRKALGHTTEAKELHSEALLIWEGLLGPGSAEVARCLTHIASLYLDEQCYDKAEPLLLRAVDEWRRSPNPHDLYAIITLSCCGNLYRSTGRADEAQGAEQAAKAVLARHAKG